jgi:GT2 family glycosyltransferase
MDSGHDEGVKVSVIIPSKCVDESSRECLGSLGVQDYREKYEIIHVIGGNIPQAKNHGLENANGRLVAFIDSDCIATENWLTNLVGTIDKLKAGGVGGPGIGPPNGDDLSLAIDCVYDSYLGSLGSSSLKVPRKLEQTTALSGHNCIYPKKVLTQVGGFDERYQMNEDTDLSHRVRLQSYELYVTPDAVVYHKRKKSFQEFFKKFISYGVSRARAMQTNQEYIDLRIIGLLGVFIAGLLISIFQSRLSKIMLLLYFAAIICHGLFYAFKRGKLALALFIPLLYLFEHTGYAFGLIIGFTRGKYRQNQKKGDIKIEKQITVDNSTNKS